MTDSYDMNSSVSRLQVRCTDLGEPFLFDFLSGNNADHFYGSLVCQEFRAKTRNSTSGIVDEEHTYRLIVGIVIIQSSVHGERRLALPYRQSCIFLPATQEYPLLKLVVLPGILVPDPFRVS